MPKLELCDLAAVNWLKAINMPVLAQYDWVPAGQGAVADPGQTEGH